MPGTGIEGFFRMKKQSGVGVPATANFRTIPIVSEEIILNIDEFVSDSLLNQPAADDTLAGPRHIEGPVNFRQTYNLISPILDSLFGVNVEQLVSVPAAGTLSRDHWFELSIAQPYYTLEIDRGDIEHVNDVHRYTDMMVSRAEFTWDWQGLAALNTTWRGTDDVYVSSAAFGSGLAQSTTPLAIDPAVYIPPTGGFTGAVTVDPAADAGGGTGYCVRQVKLVIDRKLNQTGCLGAAAYAAPYTDQLVDVTGTFFIEAKDENIYDAYAQFLTKTGNKLLFTGPIAETTIRYVQEVKLNRLRWLSPSQPKKNTRGKMVIEANFRCTGGGGTGATTTTNTTSTKEPVAMRIRDMISASTF